MRWLRNVLKTDNVLMREHIKNEKQGWFRWMQFIGKVTKSFRKRLFYYWPGRLAHGLLIRISLRKGKNMNFVTTMERTVPMQTQNTMARTKPVRLAVQHRDANPMVLVLMVVGFIAISWGAIMITSYIESGQSVQSHPAVKSLPPIFIRQ